VARALEPDELRDILEILAKDELLALRNDRHISNAQLEKTFASSGVVEHVNRFEVDAFARKKLFRPQTAASARLREKNEIVGDGIHGDPGE
jgi:hypothetical protein